jgi:L-fucose mutarotase
MLKGLSPLLSADLLHALASLGHGDEIVLADANFPSATHARRLVRLPGTSAPAALGAVLGVLPLDSFVDHAAFTMRVVGDTAAVPAVVGEFGAVLRQHGCGPSVGLERFAFCTRAAAAFAIVAAGETRIYGDILLNKGVVQQ